MVEVGDMVLILLALQMFIGRGAGGSGYYDTSLNNACMYVFTGVQLSDTSDTKTVRATNVSSNPVSENAKKGNGYARITLIE